MRPLQRSHRFEVYDVFLYGGPCVPVLRVLREHTSDAGAPTATEGETRKVTPGVVCQFPIVLVAFTAVPSVRSQVTLRSNPCVCTAEIKASGSVWFANRKNVSEGENCVDARVFLVSTSGLSEMWEAAPSRC